MSTAALCLALNTAAAPDWIELIPAGACVEGIDGRRWSNPDPEAVVTATNASARPLPLDWEHATEQRAPHGLPAPAAGWIDRLDVRAGAIWGHVDWTAPGRDHVASKQYRYVSPVFTFRKADGRIGALKSVALTNTPNLQLTALNRRGDGDAMNELEELWSILGLDENATPSDVVARVRMLAVETAANRPMDPTKWVPMETFEAVSLQLKTAGEELADKHVAEVIRAGRLTPGHKDWAIALCRQDRKAFDDFVKHAAFDFSHLNGPVIPRGKPPGSAGSLSDTETLIARQLGHTAAEMAGD